ncbi:MAG TPA: NADH-quinone oxidoreductase subunit L [Candidatus Acidoferrales bacterium]|nr:NADH-quinone oxidoreductase subunit L [Candidatus Acidoferrales bacterium]
MQQVYLIIVLAPLIAAIIAGLFGRQIGRTGAHAVTIGGVGLSCALSFWVLKAHALDGVPAFNETIYIWGMVDGLQLTVGFLVDNLTALMMCVVTFVSLMVHIYTIGYMRDDAGYQRFFSYISLFTFAMLTLVMANNFLQLFFGWEAVGLVSYLLIGFWYTRPSAVFANMKAFLVNRVGDFGFLLGIAAVLKYTGSLGYREVFAAVNGLQEQTLSIIPGMDWSVLTVICLLLFVGAMGKSAQMPLHVWLPDSMEGPTPISALIHAATMVTAGIFMVARMSPLYELSETALTTILLIGSATAFFMGLLGIVQTDIKRVVAYSTLSQLGYMTVALGVSAYSAAVFHLMTHAFFKALLFLAAGSVIIALHHEQDMRRMGGLWRRLPITYATCLIGALALIGFPGFSGFFSKDALIEAVAESHLPGAGIAYVAVLSGVFITAFYTFRLIFMVFHGAERFRDHAHDGHGGQEHRGVHEPHESPWVVTLPLVLLAIPSIAIGALTIEPMLFGGFFSGVITVSGAHDVLGELGAHYHGPLAFVMQGFRSPAIYLALAGVACAAYVYLVNPAVADFFARRFVPTRALRWLFDHKYGFDALYIQGFAGGGRALGRLFWERGDIDLIDGRLVNGTAQRIAGWASKGRALQSGFLYHYAFAMLIGLTLLLGWMLFIR